MHVQGEITMMLRMSLVLMLAVFFAFTGCDRQSTAPGKVTSEDVRRDTGRAVDTTAEFAEQNKDEFLAKLKARLKEVDTQIAVIQEKGRELKDDAKAQRDEKLAMLEAKRDAARAKFDEVQDSSAEAWKDLQKGARSAWDELDKAFQEASSEF